MKWEPKVRNEIVKKRVSFAINNASRITNVLKLTNTLVSNLSWPSSSLILLQIVQLIIFIVDSGCTKHMTGNLSLLCNFVENIWVPFVLAMINLLQFLVMEIWFKEILRSIGFTMSKGNDLLTDNRGSDLYTISLQETTSSTPICLMAKASPTQAWLWHRRLSHLNFDYINLLSKKDVVIGLPKLKYVKDQLCSSSEVSKAKRSSFKTKAIPSSKGRLNLLHMDLCGSMRVASINGKKYILVIVDDYSRYTWTLFLRSKDETPEVLKEFLIMIQQNLQALNGVVERRNSTLVKAARTMLSASKLPLIFWAEPIATACYTQNRSIIILTHEKTTYHIINDRKPSNKHLYIFGCTCYLTRDGENLDKMKEKGDPCVMVGYSTQSKGYHVYNKRTRLIVESIHIKFDEIKEMMSDHNSSDLAPQRQEMSVENVSSGLVPQGQKASDYDNSDPVPPRQNVVPLAEKTDSSQQGLEFLFSPLLEEYYNPTHGLAEENNNDQAPNASFHQDDFFNPFCTRVQEIGESSVQEIGESSSRNIDNTDAHSFQPQSHDYRWTKDHPLEHVRGNPTMPEAMADSAWIEAMQEELHQFDRLKVWELVDKPFGKMIIKLKWLWKNKKDEDQTLLAWKQFGFLLPTQHTSLFQSIIMTENGIILMSTDGGGLSSSGQKGFVDPDHPEKVYLLRKALYGLKQAPRAWYDELSNFLMSKGFSKARPTQKHLKEVKRIFKYLKGTINMGLWYIKDSGFELTTFLDADHVGCLDTRKNTSRGIQFLGDKLVSWMSKKQNGTTMSSAKAEYVALSASCAQVMWMRTQLQDYGFNYNKILTEYQLADMFTKALPEDRFKYLVRRIGMRCLTPAELEVVRLGINPMIQPEPEDLPKDNPKLEIAVLRKEDTTYQRMDFTRKQQTPKQWHQKFDEVVLSNGYLLNQADKCVYIKFDETGKGFIICLYIDDMLIFGTDQVQVDLTKEFLSSIFSIKDMGEADVILCIRIKHESNGIKISQSHYIEKVLKKFNYFNCTLVSNPKDTSEKLMPNNGQVVSQLEYSRVIGCLMYAMTYTPPDFAFAMGKLSSNSKDNSSTSGWVFLLGEGVISWASKKQICMLAYSQMYNGKSKHLGLKHNIIRELITNGVISIEFMRSQQNLADHLTKGLARDLVLKSAEGMGLKSN
ncbi:retrovirus-related pol polyprotein from transposon TNT 1-94 [Tanacetum coccineum]